MYAGKNKNNTATPFTHLWAGSDVPIKLKENTYLLLSPYYERWSWDSADQQVTFPTLHSLAFPVGLILPLSHSRWALTLMPILRWNGQRLSDQNTIQVAAVTFATYARSPNQKFRLGVYTSGEFFGVFIIPLLGADWKIDRKNYLFGVLPGRLTFQHQWNKNWYGGTTFRAPTGSYRLSSGQYIRLDDNQLSLYLDYYVVGPWCITLESGYGLFRKIRTGIHIREYITNRTWGDGPFIKLSASYRIHLDPKN